MPPSSTIIFLRFIVVVFVFVLPFAYFFILMIHIFVLKERMFLKSRIGENLHKYNNILHNIGFVTGLIGIFLHIGAIIFVALVLHNNKWLEANTYIWKFNSFTNVSLFFFIIYSGLSLYIINHIIYLFYNLFKTNSYFALKFRARYKKNKIVKYFVHTLQS